MNTSSIDPMLFRTTMSCFITGVTVITTAAVDQVYGITANAFLSVSLDPPLVLVSVNKQGRMHQHLLDSGYYGVSILSEQQETLSRHFSGRPVDGLEPTFTWVQSVPLLTNAVAYIVAHVVEAHPAGDHTLFLGHVEYLAHTGRSPLLFSRGNYGQIAADSMHEALGYEWEYMW
jgi:flavin reductase (DIM6/NTAB) family NADH-FMN oxidoreductase RutF